MSIKSRINIRALKAAAIACSKEETRYYLRGVYVHTVGEATRYVATDGHRLIVLRDNGAGDTSLEADFVAAIPGVIVPIEIIKTLKIDKETDYADFLIDDENVIGGTFHVKQLRTSTGGNLVDATFPDYSRIVPRGPFKGTAPVGQFNAQYLADFEKAGAIIEKSSKTAIISHNGVHNPAYVDFVPPNAGIEGFGVIMPIRAESAATDVPWWFDGDHPRPATENPATGKAAAKDKVKP
jgi:DNA polymerase-3 subunit beta